jgi:ArsR family transcriptional regulator
MSPRAAKKATTAIHPPDDDRFVAGAELLRALANPVRLAVVDQLHDGPRCVHELVAALGVSQPLVSQHLRVLRGARVITGERRGREVAYRLTDDHVAHIVGDALRHATEPATPPASTAPPEITDNQGAA